MRRGSVARTGSWTRLGATLAVGAAVVLSPVAPPTTGAAEVGATPVAVDRPATPVDVDRPATPVAVDRAWVAGRDGDDFLRASEAARSEALTDLAESPGRVQARCADDAGVSVCVRRREAVEQVPAVAQQVPASPDGTPERSGSTWSAPAGVVGTHAAVSTVDLAHNSGVCEGSGSDGFRVQPVYAHRGAVPDPTAIARISQSLAGVDRAFSDSAARTGGSRKVRWVTDDGSPGCRVVLRTARITTGSTDYEALMKELEAQGAVPAVGTGTVKHLVWTEGEILTWPDRNLPRPRTCGLGEGFNDEQSSRSAGQNLNLRGTRAAVDDRCWDINGGGSVPAHELMHTLGAVQQGAPNYANDGHCDDEYDLMCYGSAMRYPCPSEADNALFDCGNDDYFNTDPIVGQYLCDHWNTADSRYLHGSDQVQPPRAVTGLRVSAVPGRISVSHSGTASCYGADHYRISVAGVRTVNTSSRSVSINAPAGSHKVTVTPHSPYGNAWGVPASVNVTVPRAATARSKPLPRPNRAPVGAMVLSLTDGRGYGMLAWAIDPDTGGPTRMRMVIPGVVNREYDWNYRWADMPAHTGWNRREAFVFLAQLPPGTHRVCFDAKDADTGGWHRIECRTHSVK